MTFSNIYPCAFQKFHLFQNYRKKKKKNTHSNAFHISKKKKSDFSYQNKKKFHCKIKHKTNQTDLSLTKSKSLIVETTSMYIQSHADTLCITFTYREFSK